MTEKGVAWSSTAISETGACRKTNQDAVLALQEGDAGLFAVADGMGGHFRGELASQAAIASLEKWWASIRGCIGTMPFLDMVAKLEKKIKKINEDIRMMYEETGHCGGTTLCLLFVRGNAYAVMNIGDSRLYKCRKKRCIQMTEDDVWENQAEFRKARQVRNWFSEKKGEASYNGMLVQALGAQPGLKLPVLTGIIDKRTCFLLCSDGIYKYTENRWLLSQLCKIRKRSGLERAADRIRSEVYQHGAGDNLSLILILAEPVRDRLLW